MEIRAIFRNLVTGQYMPDFDYIYQKFSFLTLFQRTHYSYCCCECSFQHEYMDYLSENGTIDESTYNKIVQCIEEGKCPHVDAVRTEYVRESSVNAIHIAAAAGTVEAVKYHTGQNHLRYLTTGIFRLEAYITAALKNNYTCVELYFDELYQHHYPATNGFILLYAGRSKTSKDLMKIKRMSLLEICAKKKDLRLLKSILRSSVGHSNIHRAYELTFKYNLSEMQEALLNYDKDCLEYRGRHFHTGNVREGSSLAIAAIVCNQPEVLDGVLQYTPSHKLNRVFKCSVLQTCLVLQRNACYDILLRHDISEQEVEVNALTQVRHLLYLYTFYKEFREEIMTLFKQITNISHVINNPVNEKGYSFQFMMSPLHSYIDSNKCLDPQVVTAMLELGADIDVTDIHGNTALIQLIMEKRWYCEGFRDTLELLIYENPSLYLNRSAVYLGLKQDTYMKATWKLDFTNMPGNFLLDAKMHSLYGHDDAYSYALNFIGPLLIECGFPWTRDTLLNALRENLDPAELSYLRKCLDEPRSLKRSCRDVLRKNFIGQQLHTFLEASYIPSRIKDFILLKSTLLSVHMS